MYPRNLYGLFLLEASKKTIVTNVELLDPSWETTSLPVTEKLAAVSPKFLGSSVTPMSSTRLTQAGISTARCFSSSE